MELPEHNLRYQRIYYLQQKNFLLAKHYLNQVCNSNLDKIILRNYFLLTSQISVLAIFFTENNIKQFPIEKRFRFLDVI